MNILDLQNDLEVKLEFVGDNEIDANLLTIIRDTYDVNGDNISCKEEYTLSSAAIEEIRLGLEAFLMSIKDYQK